MMGQLSKTLGQTGKALAWTYPWNQTFSGNKPQIGALKSVILSILILTIGSGCANLSHISDFSASSKQSIETFESIGYGFEQSCLDNCLERSARTFDILTACECGDGQKADSVTQVVYQTLVTYLDGLYRLSMNDLARYNTGSIADQFQSGEFAGIGFDSEQVNAYINITTVLGNAVTNGYRKNKLRKYISEADSSVQVLLRYLDFNLSQNLEGIISNQESRQRVTYTDLLRETSLSTYEKRRVTLEYFERKRKLDLLKKEINLYSQMLQKVGEGHRELAINSNKLSLSALKSHLLGLSNDLYELYGNFNKIKP